MVCIRDWFANGRKAPHPLPKPSMYFYLNQGQWMSVLKGFCDTPKPFLVCRILKKHEPIKPHLFTRSEITTTIHLHCWWSHLYVNTRRGGVLENINKDSKFVNSGPDWPHRSRLTSQFADLAQYSMYYKQNYILICRFTSYAAICISSSVLLLLSFVILCLRNECQYLRQRWKVMNLKMISILQYAISVLQINLHMHVVHDLLKSNYVNHYSLIQRFQFCYHNENLVSRVDGYINITCSI